MDTKRLAVDIGGTFTDVVLTDNSSSILASCKTPTTHTDPGEGAWVGVQKVLGLSNTNIDEISVLIHGTTLATNALIERKGADVACITTEGFRDILEIGYERRYDQYDIQIEKTDFLVPRSRCFTIKERTTWNGEHITPLDVSAVPALLRSIEQTGVTSIAICLLHSYANAEHEQQLLKLIKSSGIDFQVSLSSDVSPEAREFDRLCTTVANAYIQPMMSGYLHAFLHRFKDEGLRCPVLMVTASGGMTTIETAAKLPIRLVESGPAGGAVLAAQIAKQNQLPSVLSFDMGGTTAKLCLIDEFRPQQSRHFEIARASRFIKGSGMPVRIPVLEMIEIGAGGGSIAHLDTLGRLMVGPKSAGSEPGPAAYGKGGQYPTVTDADFKLGYLDADQFAEGLIKLDSDANEQALRTHLGMPMEITTNETALGISEMVNENMANAARMHAVESGKDLGDRVMIAFGGNGPLHACRIARRAGIREIVVPRHPGVGSAVGFLYAPISFEIVRSRYSLLDQIDLHEMNTFLDDLVAEATQVVALAANEQSFEQRRTAFMRYQGQGHEIEILIPNKAMDAADLVILEQQFKLEYQRQYSRPVPGMQIEILNWGVSVFSYEHAVDCNELTHTDNASLKDPIIKKITCDVTSETVDALVYERAHISSKDSIIGPALIVESQTTTMVAKDFSAQLDKYGNLRLQHVQQGSTL